MHIKNNLTDFVVCGQNQDGAFEVMSTLTNFPAIQYLLSKGAFEMHLHQKTGELKPAQEQEGNTP